MSAIALLYMVVNPLFLKRYSEKWCYYAWMVIVVGLLIPFRPQLGLVSFETPAFNWVYFAYQNNGIILSFATSGDTLCAEATRRQIPYIQNLISPGVGHTISWWQVGFVVWLAGVIIFLAHHILKHNRFMKTVKRWSEEVTNPQTLLLYEEIKLEMGIKRHIPLYFSPICNPMMIGIIKPQIFLPSENLAYDELRFVLQHELAHYIRKDLLCKYLVIIATAVHWFNPMIQLMARAINIQCEMSCDAIVMKNADINTRHSYSKTLINAIKHQSTQKTTLSTNFYMGKKSIKSRIISIMDSRKKKMGLVVVCLAIALTIGTGFVFVTTTPTIAHSAGILVRMEQDNNLPIYIIESPNRTFTIIDYTSISFAHIIEFNPQIQPLPSPVLSLEEVALILAEAIEQKFDFCIDGLVARMVFGHSTNGESEGFGWSGNIFSEELTTHDSGGNELFSFSIWDTTGDVLGILKNTIDTPFLG